MLWMLLSIQNTYTNSVDSRKLQFKKVSTWLAKVLMFRHDRHNFLRTDTGACNGHSWRRGKAMTAPNTDKRTINSQKGTFLVCLRFLALFATTMSLPSSPVLSDVVAGGLDCSLSVVCSDIDRSGACSCSYLVTYSGNSFLKLGQFLLSAKKNRKPVMLGSHSQKKNKWKQMENKELQECNYKPTTKIL